MKKSKTVPKSAIGKAPLNLQPLQLSKIKQAFNYNKASPFIVFFCHKVPIYLQRKRLAQKTRQGGSN